MSAAYQVAEDQGYTGGLGVDVRASRFFVQMGFGEVRVDTEAVRFRNDDGNMVYRTLPRGRIVECATYPHRTNINEIREGQKIEGSEENDREGRLTYGRYWREAYFEAERLIDVENGSKWKSGLVEVKALGGLASVVYGRGTINSLFYPDGFASLPEKNVDLLRHLEGRVSELKRQKPPNVADLHYSIILQVGDELVAAARHADSVQRSRLEFTHTCMRVNPSDDLFKFGYDWVDEEMLLRTGVPRIHQDSVMTAEALKTLAEGKGQGGGSEIDVLRSEVADLKASLRKREDQIDALVNKALNLTPASEVVETPKAKPGK